jgi:hypothetical protein
MYSMKLNGLHLFSKCLVQPTHQIRIEAGKYLCYIFDMPPIKTCECVRSSAFMMGNLSLHCNAGEFHFMRRKARKPLAKIKYLLFIYVFDVSCTQQHTLFSLERQITKGILRR